MYSNTEENINTVGVDADERICEHGPVRGVKWKRTSCTQKDILCEDEHANVREDEHLEYEDEYEHAPISVQTLIQIKPQYQAERANRHEPYGRNNTNTEEKGDHGVSGEKTLALAGNQLTPSELEALPSPSTSVVVTVTAAVEDRETGKSVEPLEENSININININTSELIKKLGGVFIWTKQDDRRLLQILERHPPVNKQRSNWDMVAQELNQLCESESASASVLASSSSTKTPKECFQRWTLYLSPPPRNLHKRRFTVEEDAIIVHSVQSAHPSKPCWTDICKLLSANHGNSTQTQTQTHEQPHPQPQPHAPHRIRERWHNLLNPKLQKMPFTNEEDVKLYEGPREHGQKWTVISKDFFLDTRSDIQLKNRFRTVTFQQFYAKVSARALVFEKRDRERLKLGLGACANMDAAAGIVGAEVDSNIDMDADVVVPVEVDIAMDMNVSKGQGITTSVLRDGDDDTGMERHAPMDADRSLTDTNRKLVNDLNRGTSLLNGTDAEVEADTNVRIDANKHSIHVDDINPGESGNGPAIANHIAKRLKRSLAAQIQGEDVPKPPPGKYFTPIGAAQILSRIGKSERRTVMRTWIDRNYVPVNLTSLYRTLGRYNSGKTLKPRWYCEGRMKSAG